MGNLMENMKKAQQLVQVEAARVQEELAAWVAQYSELCHAIKAFQDVSDTP